MMACRTHRQVNAGRVPRCAPLSMSGTKEAARRVTTVALISNARIWRQHTQGRVFRANSFRERSMQFDKQFHGGRSPVVLTGHEASRYSTEISALPVSSEDDATRRSTVAAAARFIVKAAAGFAACAEVAVPDFLPTVVSWTFAQALAGCAAYGEAMYPGFVSVGESVDQRDPARGTPSEHGNPNQLQSRTSGLSEISPIANDGIRGRAPFLVSRQTRSSAAALVKTEHIERSERTHAAVAGWSTSIASFLASLRSRIRCGRDSRLTIAKLRSLDDRRLRDIGISRSDIEHLEGRGDRCE
ncbi:protein of unknown function [Bradyrhizobium erythrophlei]|uniref:YjiS-like domain-containing protein n=2 Tax=Bradyrhizobium erythrophlei TaxID=1437360 RepID=A0A1M5NWS2_9BRAD|nr:protein of unknown function [Bradyrhizobium erythrophlei]